MVRIDYTHGQKCPYCGGTVSKTKDGWYYCSNGCFHEDKTNKMNNKKKTKVPSEFDFQVKIVYACIKGVSK